LWGGGKKIGGVGVAYIDLGELQETLVEHEVVQQVRGSFLLRGLTNIQGDIS
jgi:hypothetical protein